MFVGFARSELRAIYEVRTQDDRLDRVGNEVAPAQRTRVLLRDFAVTQGFVRTGFALVDEQHEFPDQCIEL